MLKEIKGDLLEAKTTYIAHQTNCLSKGKAAGLAKFLFDKFPYADTYKDRVEDSIPGTIDVFGNGKDQRYVINMNAQIYPGKPKFGNGPDSAKNREQYFQLCLDQIEELLKNTNDDCAFAGYTGAGLAGGEWSSYKLMILNFSKKINGNIYIIYLNDI